MHEQRRIASCRSMYSGLYVVESRIPKRLDIAAFHFVHEVIAGADAQGHDGKRRILAGIGCESGSVHDE